jgi:hypothetical protein
LKKASQLEKLAKVYFGMIKSNPKIFDKFYQTIRGGFNSEFIRFELEELARPISAQCYPSSKVDVEESQTVKFGLECDIELKDVFAEIWLDEVTNSHQSGQNFSVVSQSIASNSMVDVFSLGRKFYFS